MPVTQIPSRDPLAPPETVEQRDLSEAQHWESAYRGFNPDDVPHLLIQLQDDLSRARKREALWLSVILHLFVVILLWNSEKLMDLLPHRTVDLTMTANDKAKDATFLELPPDEQKLTKRPDAKVISDKDRIATSKAPQINHEDLKRILSSHPGTSLTPPPGQAAPMQSPSQNPQNPVAQNQAPQPSSGFTQQQSNDQTARLQTPPQNRPKQTRRTPARRDERA